MLLVGGYMDPNVVPTYQKLFFEKVSSNALLIPVSVGFCNSFGDCRDKVIEAVDEACPNHDPVWTSEVDVVGVSLGGLVARYAAARVTGPGASAAVANRKTVLHQQSAVGSKVCRERGGDRI